jgi:hypothetical protein
MGCRHAPRKYGMILIFFNQSKSILENRQNIVLAITGNLFCVGPF